MLIGSKRVDCHWSQQSSEGVRRSPWAVAIVVAVALRKGERAGVRSKMVEQGPKILDAGRVGTGRGLRSPRGGSDHSNLACRVFVGDRRR